MPEIDREKVRAMLAEVPQGQQEALLVRLKERGYTVAPIGAPQAKPPMSLQDRIQSIPRTLGGMAQGSMGNGVMGRAANAAIQQLPTAMGMNAQAPIPGAAQAQNAVQGAAGAVSEGLGRRGVPAPLSAAAGMPLSLAASAIPTNVGELALAMASPEVSKSADPKGLNVAKSRIPAVFRQLFGIPERSTEQVLKSGPSAVLQPEIADTQNSIRLLQKAQSLLDNNRKEAGKSIERAEEAISVTKGGSKMFDVSPLATKLKDAMTRLGYFGNVADMADKGEVAQLKQVLGKLSSGLVEGRDLISMRRFLDNMVEYKPGNLKPVGSQASRLIKGVASELRGVIDNAYPDLGKANAEFSRAATIFGRFRKLLGGQSGREDNMFSDLDAIQKIRSRFLKSKTSQNIIKQFDKHIANGEGTINKLFDSIAARDFDLEAPAALSPSSPIMRGGAVLGVTAPKMGAMLLKTREEAGKVASGKSALPIKYGAMQLYKAALDRARKSQAPPNVP